MQNRVMASLTRLAIIFIFLVGICICAWWYPFSISLTAIGIVSGESASTIPVSASQSIEFWTQLSFYWLTSLPCFAVLIFGWKSTSLMKFGNEFDPRNADIFRKISLIIFVDSLFFIIGNIVFMFMQWNPFAIIYYVIGTVGLIFSLISYAAHKYMCKAAAIKADNDSII